MSSFFTLSLEPKITRDYVSLEHSDVQLLADGIIEVSASGDLNSNTNVWCVGSNFRGADIIATDFASMTITAEATKRTNSHNFTDFQTNITADKKSVTQSLIYAYTNVYFNGGRLYDFVVNARYAKPGYASEGYVADIPAAPVIATVDVDGDKTSIILTAFNTAMSVDADAIFNPSINIAGAFTPSILVNTVTDDSIPLAVTSSVFCEALRIHPGTAVINVETNSSVEAVKTTDIISDFNTTTNSQATAIKILGNILIDNMSSPFVVSCQGDDLILDEGFIGCQATFTLDILAGFKAVTGAAMNINATLVLTTSKVLHTEEYVYKIPPETRYYKINSETRIKEITEETGIFKIPSETRIKAVNPESRIHKIRR